jgi:hypothetical protein
MSERRACRLVIQPRGTQRYQQTLREDEDALARAITDFATQYGRYGYRRITALCWIESRMALISSRPAPTRIDSGELWRCERRKGSEAATPSLLPPLRSERAVLRTAQVSAPAAMTLTRCQAKNHQRRVGQMR